MPAPRSLTASLAEGRAVRLEARIKELERQNRILTEAAVAAAAPKRTCKIVPAKASRHPAEIIRVAIPDSHGSAIDTAAAAAFLADLKRLDPHEIVMGGDHVNCGGFLAQHHVLGYVAETPYTYDDDIAAANLFLDQIQKAAPRAVIHYLEGNHERRVETWCVTQTLRNAKDAESLRKVFAPEFRLNLVARGIKYYRQAEHYHGLSVPGAIRLGKCHFWHGTSTAKHAASVNVAQVGGNVVYFHTHREDATSLRPVATGDIGAWNPGCLCQLQPLWCHTRPTNWTHGYGLQLVGRSGRFLHVNVRIVKGASLLLPLLKT